MSPQECGLRTKITKIQRQSRPPRRHRKKRFWFVCSIYWTRFMSFANDCCKTNGCYCRTTKLWRTSSRRDICLHSGKDWRTLQDSSEFRSQNVYIFGYVFHDTNGQNHGLTLKIQWYLLNDICPVTHSQTLCGKDTSRKFCWSLDGKKYRIGNVFLFIENSVYSFRYTWME